MDGPELRIVLIHRRTRLADLIARHNTLDQARFYVERLGGDFADYVREDARYRAVLTQAEQALRARGRVQPLERGFLPNYLFGRDDLVVVVGQDGLVANTLKYLDGQAVIAVNPDPSRFAGVLLPFAVEDLPAIVPEARAGTRPIRDLAMAEARLSDGQRLLAVNDLFLGPRRHTTAAYVLQHGERSEAQWSSGLIVSTGLGATGWLGSILAGAAALGGALGQDLDPRPLTKGLTWDSRHLLFAVREPYAGTAGRTELVYGRVDARTPLVLESRMAEEGVIFSDGMLDDALPFNAGTRAEVRVADGVGRLVV